MKPNKAIVDIDGVVADYRLGLLWWVNTNYPRLRDICYHHLNRKDTWIDHNSMNVPYRVWLDILEKFRMSGGKMLIPTFPGAGEFFEFLQQRDLDVILLTSRPIDIYSNIYRDTVEWLQEKGFKYQLLLWSKSKADIVHKLRFTDEVVFAVDDEYGHCLQYADLGMRTYWLDHYQKAGSQQEHPNIVVVHTLNDIIKQEASNG